MRRLFLIAILMVMTFAAPASAHAELVSTSPMSSQQLKVAPQSLSMHFSEPVTATQDTFRVYDQHAKQIKTRKAMHPGGDATALTTVVPKLEDGRYTVVWRVVSADSHPIHGAFDFSVGATADEGGNFSQTLLSSDHASPAVRALQAITRGILLFGIMGAIGAALWLHIWRDEFTRRVARACLVVVGVATAVGVLSQGVYTNARPLGSLFDVDLLHDTLGTRYGHGAELRLLAIVLGLAFLRNRVATAVSAVMIVCSLAIAGHAGTGRLPYAGLTLDVLHIGAASAWFGGLGLVLVAITRHRENTRAALRTFSRVALICASTILLTGILQAFRQLHSWHALASTDYGRLVITKLILFAVIVTIAPFSRRAVRAWNPGALRTLVAIEVVFAIAVIIVTTVLISTSPSATKPISYDRISKLNGNVIRLHVDKTATGPESMAVTVDDSAGRPVNVPEVTMSLTLANEGIGPLDVALRADGPGRYSTTSATVPLPGTWSVRVTVRTTDIDQSSTSFAVPVS